MSRFTSRRDGYNRAIATWHCRACNHHQQEKMTVCDRCGTDAVTHFPSLIEHKRGCELLLLATRGLIRNLKFHPRYDLKVEMTKVCTWTADSSYFDVELDRHIVEDVKPVGWKIDRFSALKIKIFNAIYAQHRLSVTIRRMRP